MKTAHLLRTTLPALLLAGCAAAWAEPGYYVVTAYDNEGQRTVDLRYWTSKSGHSATQFWPEVGLGYGVTSRWYTEILASYVGTRDTATKLYAVNWQNEFLLTQGEYPIDVALHLNIAKNSDSGDGYTIEYGPVLQTDIGRTQLNANLFFERDVDADTSSPTTLKYQWQVKHRWRPALQFGLQGFGELGTWNHWASHDRQSHRAGPALFGRVPVGNQAVMYQAAWLIGSIYGKSGNMFSLRAQYAF